MKATDLKELIVKILQEKPRLFDGVCVKDIKSLLLEHYKVSVSDRIIIKVMMELTRYAEGDGHECGDGSVLVWGDEHMVCGSKLHGIHKYWWANM
jgi:hypothetical protein